jgi:hypothetical protein
MSTRGAAIPSAGQPAPARAGLGMLPWLVAVAFFMESLDTTILNTAVPAVAEALQVARFSLPDPLGRGTGAPTSLGMVRPGLSDSPRSPRARDRGQPLMWNRKRTRLRVELSQVPRGEGPGAPSASECVV